MVLDYINGDLDDKDPVYENINQEDPIYENSEFASSPSKNENGVVNQALIKPEEDGRSRFDSRPSL